jgi:hypothetical protein
MVMVMVDKTLGSSFRAFYIRGNEVLSTITITITGVLYPQEFYQS